MQVKRTKILDSQFHQSLWDISVEEDVSAFYLEFGALDIFVELFSNPNHRFNAQSSLFVILFSATLCLELFP